MPSEGTRLELEQRRRIAYEVSVGVSLWFLANCWSMTEARILRIAGLSRAEWDRRHALRLRLLPEHAGDTAALNRAVLAASTDRPMTRPRFTISNQAPNNSIYAERCYGVWDVEQRGWAMLPNAVMCWGMTYDDAADALIELRGGMRAEGLRDAN